MAILRDYFLNHYSRTDFHELNLDWMITMLYDMIDQVENFVSRNAVKYANPIQWNITSQYEKNTIVVDPFTGTAYISSKPVPMGVPLSRTEYWSVIFDLGRFITLASQNFANSYEAVLTTTATMPTDKDKWLVWNSILYRAKNDIHVGDMYVVDGNIEKYTVEMFFDELTHLIAEETEARIEADTTLHGEIVDESVARENADTTLQDNIDAEATARENADTTLQGNIDAEALARENADTTLQGNIDAEALAREDADDTINARIDDIVSDLPLSVYANILDYGAESGGITDCRQSIIDAMASGKPVFIPEGIFRVSNEIEVGTGVHIVGVGIGQSILRFDEQTTAQRYMFANYTYDVWKKGAIFKNFTIDVNNYVQASRNFHGGIFLGAFEDILIDNIEVLNTSTGGNGVTLWKCRRGTVSNCYFHELYGSGCYVCNKSHEINVTNNKVINSYVTSGALDVYDSDNIVLSGNYVEPNNDLTFGFNLDTIRQCIIANNNCNGGRTGISTFVASECVISNNTCRNSAFAGIQLEMSVDGVTGSSTNQIVNNFISYSGQFGIVDTCNSYYHIIRGNQISHSGRTGIHIINASYATIESNQIYDSATENPALFADIELTVSNGSSVYCTVNNNVCNSGSIACNIITRAGVSGLMICNNNCPQTTNVANIIVADTAGLIIANNRGTTQ